MTRHFHESIEDYRALPESWPTRSRRYRATLARIIWTLFMCGVVAAILTVVAAVAVSLTVTL